MVTAVERTASNERASSLGAVIYSIQNIYSIQKSRSTMKHALAFSLLWAMATVGWTQDAPIFSGPQPGEKLASFKFRGVVGKDNGKQIDIVKAADGKPILLVFVHDQTRPSFGLATTLMHYAQTRAKDGLHSAAIFLSDDPTSAEKWMQRVTQYLPKGVSWGISPEGVEGPGSYGLNRKVSVTVLVGKAGKVTANFALVQPSLQADGPKILKALTSVAGGKAPSLAVIQEETFLARAKMDSQLAMLVAAVMRKDFKDEQSQAAAKALEKHVGNTPRLKRLVGATLRKKVRDGETKDLSKVAQGEVRRLIRKFQATSARRPPQRPKTKRPNARKKNAPDLGPYLRPVINKNATPKEVDEAAAKVDKYVADKPAAQQELGRIATTVSNSDVFER